MAILKSIRVSRVDLFDHLIAANGKIRAAMPNSTGVWNKSKNASWFSITLVRWTACHTACCWEFGPVAPIFAFCLWWIKITKETQNCLSSKSHSWIKAKLIIMLRNKLSTLKKMKRSKLIGGKSPSILIFRGWVRLIWKEFSLSWHPNIINHSLKKWSRWPKL